MVGFHNAHLMTDNKQAWLKNANDYTHNDLFGEMKVKINPA